MIATSWELRPNPTQSLILNQLPTSPPHPHLPLPVTVLHVYHAPLPHHPEPNVHIPLPYVILSQSTQNLETLNTIPDLPITYSITMGYLHLMCPALCLANKRH